MANLQNRDNPGRMIETSCCKCSRSDLNMNKQQCAPYLEDAVSKFKERRGSLFNRQQYLTEKITTMERCIPALMAFNMWTSGQNCNDPPLCKVRQIINRLSPNSDPTEKLVEKLKGTVESLNMETAELHEKIIEADVALEESGMELDSILLANEECEEKLKSLEKELKINKTPSLHSITSEDLFCLSKIRQLGEEQVNLKNGIRELEEREAMFHERMNRLLTSKEFRNGSCNGERNKKIAQCERNERRLQGALHEHKNDMSQQKKKLMGKGKENIETETPENSPTTAKHGSENTMNPTELPGSTSIVTSSRDTSVEKKLLRRLDSGKDVTCNCPTQASNACYDKSSCPRANTSTKSRPSRSNLEFCNTCMGTYSRHSDRSSDIGCSPKSCGLPLVTKANLSRGQVCESCCKASGILSKSPSMSLKSAKSDHQSGISRSQKSARNSSRQRSPATRDLHSPCKRCQGFPPCNECFEPIVSTSSRCSCKGKCALGVSDVPCNCAEYLSSIDDEGYQPSGDLAKRNDQSSTDDEYCECCDCGCEDSDELSDSCQC